MKRLAALSRSVEDAAGRIARWTAAHPHAVLAGWLVFTLLPAGGLLRLHRDTDGQAMVPRADPAIHLDRETRDLFDLRDQLVIYCDTNRPNGIFDPTVLTAVEQITDLAVAIPEIGRGHVRSLHTEARARLFPGWSETFRDFLTPLPVTSQHLAELEQDLEHPAARIYAGTIMAADRSGAAIFLGIPRHGEIDREAVYRQVEAMVAPWRRDGLEIYVVGAPAAEAILARYILRDIGLLVPLALVVIAVVIRLGTGRLAPALLILPKVGACIFFTFGVLGWLGWPIYLTVAIVPVVLAAMSIADEIHVITRYQAVLDRAGPNIDRRGAVAATFDSLTLPVVGATLTTCAGFLSCLPSVIAPVQALGVAAAIGTMYSMFFTLIAMPALLVLLPSQLFVSQSCRPAPGQPVVRSSSSGRRMTLITISLLTLLALAGASRVIIQDSWIDNFSSASPFRLATERVNDELFGIHRLEIRLQFPKPGVFDDPEVLAALETLESRLRAHVDVGGVIGPYSQLEAVAEFWNLGEAFRRGEQTQEVVPRFDFAPGRLRRQRVLTDDLSQGVMTVFLKGANFRDTASIMSAVTKYHDQLLEPFGSEFSFAGDVAVSQAMIPAVVRNQVRSLPLALGCVFLVVAVLTGSLRLAFYAILPVGISGIWLLGVLGAAGISLGVASSMFFVLAIGLGVDSHSIHLVMRFRKPVEDPLRAIAEIRRPILLNTLAVALGFGLLAFSRVPANRTMGILIASGLGLGCALTLTGLAALLISTEKRRFRGSAEADSSLDKGGRNVQVFPTNRLVASDHRYLGFKSTSGRGSGSARR